MQPPPGAAVDEAAADAASAPASSGDERGRAAPRGSGPPLRRPRRSRPEKGIGRWTLRFTDHRREEAFAHTHKAQLSHQMALGMAAICVWCFLNLAARQFWDDSRYPTREARVLSRWQLLLTLGLVVFLLVVGGFGRLCAKRDLVSTLGLEVIVVSGITVGMILSVLIPKHYMARAFGHADTEAIWGHGMGATDCNLVLMIDLAVTSVHLLMPIRWVVLVPLQVAAVLAYLGPALFLGSPAMGQVPFNIFGILALVALSAVGKRASERKERLLFAGLLSEKQMRFQAEFELSKVDSGGEGSAAPPRPGSTLSAAAFDRNAQHPSLGLIRAIGEQEQWLIASGEVQLLTDGVLGSGGFGLVVMGLYHNTPVAVKAPREDMVREGVLRSCLPALCNELRILRRIRHPNIAFLYGACLGAGLRKLCLVLELVDGVPLGAFVRGPRGAAEPRRGAPQASGLASSASVQSALILDILNALRHLHSRQPVVVHGDLKDSNVFVEERRRRSGRSSHHAKLLDFGLSRLVTSSAEPLGGSLRWMAPELLSRKAVPPDDAADCYSFGLLTYLILTGRLPFEDKHTKQVQKQLRRGQPRPPSLAWPAPASELARACRPAVEQCIQAAPALRPQTESVSDHLAAVLSRFAGGALERAVESPVDGVPGRGGEPLASGGPAAADTPASGAHQELQGPLGQAGDARVVALASDMGFGSLPHASEHRALGGSPPPVGEPALPMLSGEALGRTAAPSRESPGGVQEQLASPEHRLTPLSTRALTLVLLMLEWTGPTARGACCWLHGALRHVDTVREELRSWPCKGGLGVAVCGQCDTCGLLLTGSQTASLGNSLEHEAHSQSRSAPLNFEALALAFLMLHWNAPMPRDACCWLHGALRAMDTVREELGRWPCNLRPEFRACDQCDTWGLLKSRSLATPELSESPGASVVVEGPFCGSGDAQDV
ncbi:unnamed protein product [Prorocentrum cordatum]|uniref:Protein kinase domain-containing protein n=2 Tax=Prorocentrum cordatum TaxID=2364126 RepID=A0ABN9TM94_9DINO|nr:unnamed protein product [Polarella glacialis]